MSAQSVATEHLFRIFIRETIPLESMDRTCFTMMLYVRELYNICFIQIYI